VAGPAGLIGGVVLAAAAGARRTDTAYPRLLRWANAAQVDVVPNTDGLPTAYFTALGRLPQVASMSTTGSPEPQLASPLAFRVSAIVADTQIVPGVGTNGEPTALLSPPFTATAASRRASYGIEAGIRLRPGASTGRFVAAATALAKQYPASGGKIDIISMSDGVAATQRAIRPEAAALALFAGLAGLIALAVIVQLLSRQPALDSAGFPVLRALGMTRGALVKLSLARTAVVTGAGGLIAVGAAIAAGPGWAAARIRPARVLRAE